jgi:hypothetical protein
MPPITGGFSIIKLKIGIYKMTSTKLIPFDQVDLILQSTLTDLHEEAEKNRGVFNGGKLAGGITTVLGGIGCFGLPVIGIPAAVVGAGLYLSSLFTESSTVGKILPIPFCSTSAVSMVQAAIQESSGISDEDLELLEYLPKRDRILYLLILIQGKRMAHMLSQLPQNQWQSALEAVISRTAKILNSKNIQLDYSNAFLIAPDMVDEAEEALGLPISRIIPQAVPQQTIGTNTQLNAIEVSSTPVEFSMDYEVPSLDLSNDKKTFDWNLLNTAYTDFSHLFLLGKTGSGKSYLSDRLVRFLEGYTLVITPKKMPQDFKGLDCVGVPYNYQSIYKALTSLEQLMIKREAKMQETGDVNFPPVNVILDELPVASEGCKDEGLDLTKPLKALIRAGRTSKIRLIILAQGQEVKTLGIEGQGSLRDNLTFIYLKGFVEKYAQDNKIDISGIERPCIIDGQVADTSFLKKYENVQPKSLNLGNQQPQPQPQPYEEPKEAASTTQDLERIYKMPCAEHEVFEEGQEKDSIEELLKCTFPSWNESSIKTANKVINFLSKNPERKFKADQIKSSVADLKKVTADRSKALLNVLVDKAFISNDGKEYFISPNQVFNQEDEFNW